MLRRMRAVCEAPCKTSCGHSKCQRNAKSPVHYALKNTQDHAHTVDAIIYLTPSPAVFFGTPKAVGKCQAAANCVCKDRVCWEE